MKLPAKVRATVDGYENLSASEKAKVLRHLGDIADSLPEHPTSTEAKRIVNGALKSLKIVVGSDDSEKSEKKDDDKKEEKKEKKEDKKDKEEVKESKKVTFKQFISESSN